MQFHLLANCTLLAISQTSSDCERSLIFYSVMGSNVEYVDSSHIYASNYVRNSKAIGVLWGIFSICYVIIVAVILVTPEWLGGDGAGRVGLWEVCIADQCRGSVGDLQNQITTSGTAAAILVSCTVILSILAVLAMILMFFCKSTTVIHICGWFQVASGVCLTAACITFPVGWDAPEVKQICGTTSAKFQPGDCAPRWPIFLAILGCTDAIMLSALAFILATRHIRLKAEPLYKGELNSAYVSDAAASTSGSRKSGPGPLLILPAPPSTAAVDPDRFSEFSQRTARSKASAYRAEYASSIQNFQL